MVYLLDGSTYISRKRYLVDVDNTEGEADVHDDKDEEEDEDVDDHVGHADDDRTRLPPHQAKLIA